MANGRALFFARGFGVRFALGAGSNAGSAGSTLARLGRGAGKSSGRLLRDSGNEAAMALARAFALGLGAGGLSGDGVRSLRFLTGGIGGWGGGGVGVVSAPTLGPYFLGFGAAIALGFVTLAGVVLCVAAAAVVSADSLARCGERDLSRLRDGSCAVWTSALLAALWAEFCVDRSRPDDADCPGTNEGRGAAIAGAGGGLFLML